MAKKYSKEELADWFREKALAVRSGGEVRNRLFRADERYADVNSEFVGGMYFYRYDPKYKMKLPIYDKYPLTIVIDRYNDGFLGLNTHYLSKGQRGTMIGLFNDFYSKKKLFNGIIASGAQSNWDLIDSSGGGLSGLSQQAVKRYLYVHVRSQFIRINEDEYDKAIQLPIEEWVQKG